MKKKLKVALIIGMALTLILVIGTIAINVYVTSFSEKYIKDINTVSDADCILVPGAGVVNGEPSYMLKDRLNRAIELYRQGKAPKIIMSGDHGRQEYDEVNVMKSYAIAHGIPSENIFMDHAGFSTYESVYRAKEIFKAKSVIIVTQEYHIYRALYSARMLGLEAEGVCAEGNSYRAQFYRDAREVLARVKDFFVTAFKLPPKFLGEAIPVSGNGDSTND